jgi:hypothetical protein
MGNYILKVQGAKTMDIQKALQAAGLKVVSIIEVYKDKSEEAPEAKGAEA